MFSQQAMKAGNFCRDTTVRIYTSIPKRCASVYPCLLWCDSLHKGGIYITALTGYKRDVSVNPFVGKPMLESCQNNGSMKHGVGSFVLCRVLNYQLSTRFQSI